jgi:hypothetical protein
MRRLASWSIWISRLTSRSQAINEVFLTADYSDSTDEGERLTLRFFILAFDSSSVKSA